jgi:integrase
MGSIQRGNKPRKGKSAGWRAMWRDGQGRQRARTFDRKVDAERFLAQIEADLVRGHYIDPTAGQVTLSEYTEQWLAAQVWRPSTRYLAESHIKNHIGPALGSRPLATITRTDIQGFVRDLSDQGLAPSTVKTIYARLVSILQAAVHDRVIAFTPAVKIALPKADRRANGSVVVLHIGDVHRIADAVPPWLRGLVWVMASAGLRPGEAAGLTVERVDFMRRHIVVDRQMLTVTGQPVQLAPPKTASSIRTVPIPDSLITELNRHMSAHPPAEVEPGATLLFTNLAGRALRRSTLAEVWGRARKTLDLPAEARGWHTLRHTYASMLIEGGLSVKAVQARLGHASATETLEVYSHLWPDSDDDTRAAVERGLATPESPSTAEPSG